MVPELERLIPSYIRTSCFLAAQGFRRKAASQIFRSVDGLYHQKFKYPPETMLSHYIFMSSHTAEFFDFYRQKLIVAWGQA